MEMSHATLRASALDDVARDPAVRGGERPQGRPADRRSVLGRAHARAIPIDKSGRSRPGFGRWRPPSAESSAILTYLARRTGSSAYPSDPRRRALVDERLEWINANVYPSFGYDLVYPQLFPHERSRCPKTQAALLERAADKSRRWLRILDQSLIGPNQLCLCGNAITIADYLGASLLTVGEAIGCDFSQYPNIHRWLRTMRRLNGWPRVFATFDSLVASLCEKRFVRV